MEKEIYDLGREAYRQATGYNDLDRDKDGFIVLRPTAKRVDQQVTNLTTSIGDLESRLGALRAQKAEAEKYKKTDAYAESKAKAKEEKKKGKKKKRNDLLQMVFNNADAMAAAEAEAEENDEEGYRDNKKKKKDPKAEKRSRETTLETQYGKRYAPIVSMYYDNMADFDRFAKQLEEELNSPKGQTRNMYRSTQIGNMLSAMDKRAGMVDKIARIADKLTDIEYRKSKDKAEDDSNGTKAVAALGAQYLRGVFDTEDAHKKKGKGSKKDKKEKTEGNFARQAKAMGYKAYLAEDDDDDEDAKKQAKAMKDKVDSEKELAKALADELLLRKDVRFTDHEKHLDREGKYVVMVICDALKPDKDWKFVAVNPKTNRIIEDPDGVYKKLLPSKKAATMRFDLPKLKCMDTSSGRSYKLMFKD